MVRRRPAPALRTVSVASMCGIAGAMLSSDERAESLLALAGRMSACIAHRGPDDDGHWAEPSAGLALAFRRLAIIDVSPAGHQPMRSRSGRYTIVFNGEVYNYRELRDELRASGHSFDGGSDTEVILAAFEQWGIAAAVTRFVGMFGIATWDARDRELVLVRDRLGIKPLYLYQHDGTFLFGSELKSVLACPGVDRSIDETALAHYLRYLYVPAPRSILRHVTKLAPGTLLRVRDARAPLARPEPYWSLDDVYRAARGEPFEGTDDEAVDALDEVLGDAVRLRMRADVPMGALLSGGVDSSLVVALMQRQTASPVRTFCIAFPGTEHDEAAHARHVADRLGTHHTELPVTGADALAVVPRLAEMFDEPLADPSQVPTYLVCHLARRDVTVALTGDGGDELFAGYERYVRGERLIAGLGRIPPPVRRAVGRAIGRLSTDSWDRLYGAAVALRGGRGATRLAGQKVRKLGAVMSERSPADMYRALLTVGWRAPETFLPSAAGAADDLRHLLARRQELPFLDAMLLTDQGSYLADDLLAKVDRASMATSLEARVPILDHRVVHFSWRLPARMKVRDGRGKWILRQLLYRHVEPALVDRPKTGFSVPIAAWLRGPLREWAADTLLGDLRGSPLRADAVRRAWAGLQGGADDSALGVWTLVMFEAWRQRWVAS